MRCSHGFVIPGTDSRFLYPPINTPDSYLRFPRVHYPTRMPFRSVKTTANINNRFVNDELSFYELLGIPESGTLPEIKQAYKQLARKYHPDVSPPDRVGEYTERFIRVQEAYETLSDPRRRALYDRDMASGLHLAFSARRRHRYDQVFFTCFLVGYLYIYQNWDWSWCTYLVLF